MCCGGEQVLGVNNVTSLAPQCPYRIRSAVLSASRDHKGTPVGNGVAVRVEAEKWALHLEFIHFALPPPHPHPLLLCVLSSQAGRVQAADGFRKGVVD